MKLIIAGNYEQYLRYLKETNHTPQEAKYCCRMEDIMGYSGAEIVRYGEYWENPLDTDIHLRAIEDQFKELGVRKRR